MLVVERTDPSAPVAHGVDALNNSLGFADPASMFRYFSKTSLSPNGINWGHYADPLVDGLLMQAQQSFDSEQKIELLAQAHAIVVDEEAAGDYVALAVEDTGAGMPPPHGSGNVGQERLGAP
jgi:ABC-type transport system substrate-binding protein